MKCKVLCLHNSHCKQLICRLNGSQNHARTFGEMEFGCTQSSVTLGARMSERIFYKWIA